MSTPQVFPPKAARSKKRKSKGGVPTESTTEIGGGVKAQNDDVVMDEARPHDQQDDRMSGPNSNAGGKGIEWRDLSTGHSDSAQLSQEHRTGSTDPAHTTDERTFTKPAADANQDDLLSFQDIQHAEASQEARTPLKRPITDRKGSILTDDLDDILQHQSNYVRALVLAFNNEPSDQPGSANVKFRSPEVQARWKEWQLAEYEKYLHRLRTDESDVKAFENRIWAVLKEVIAVHRVGYMDGLPAEEGMTCSQRVAHVLQVFTDFVTARIDMTDFNKSFINMPFLVAAPKAYAERQVVLFHDKFLEPAQASMPSRAVNDTIEQGLDAEDPDLPAVPSTEQPEHRLSKKERKIIQQAERELAGKTRQKKREKSADAKKHDREVKRLLHDSNILFGVNDQAEEEDEDSTLEDPRGDEESQDDADGNESTQGGQIAGEEFDKIGDTATPGLNKGRPGGSRQQKRKERKDLKKARDNKEKNKHLAQSDIASAGNVSGTQYDEDDKPRGRPLLARPKPSSSSLSQNGETSKRSPRSGTPAPTRKPSIGRPSSRPRSQTPGGRDRSEVRKENDKRERDEAAKAQEDHEKKVKDQSRQRKKRRASRSGKQ